MTPLFHARPKRAHNFTRVALYAGVTVLAVAVAYIATRGTGEATATPRTKSAAVAAPIKDSTKPVSLTSEEARRIGVTFATVALTPLARDVRTVGQVTFDETRVRTIALKIDGWVEQLFVNATGQYVAPGQPLLRIYSPMLVSAEEELVLAKRLQGDVSGASDDARRSASDLLTSSRRRLAYWDVPQREIAEVERTGVVRKSLTLVAPSGGYVLEKNVFPGQKVMAGDALYKVADLSTVWIEGEVFEQEIATVHLGQTVHADFQALPGEHRMGQISYVYPTLSQATRTVRVRVVMSNGDMRLKPGMYATIRIAGTEHANTLTVPRSAVLSTGERSLVFVRDASGALVAREVSVGASSEDRVEILRGLTAGETVVASATFLVDAESSLRTALGGMGNMPGMEMTTPPRPLPMKPGGKE